MTRPKRLFQPVSVAGEEWRPVPGWPRYRISNIGRVANRYKLKTPTPDKKGYLQVSLNDNYRRACAYVHRLVAAAFIGPCPDGKEVNHIDAVVTNNRIENLEYVTHAQNIRHAADLGLCRPHRGESSRRAILTEREVRDIRRRYRAGETILSISKDLGRKYPTVSGIVHRWSWKHVPSDELLMDQG